MSINILVHTLASSRAVHPSNIMDFIMKVSRIIRLHQSEIVRWLRSTSHSEGFYPGSFLISLCPVEFDKRSGGMGYLLLTENKGLHAFHKRLDTNRGIIVYSN